MRAALGLALAGAGIAGLAACCPIPVPRQVTVRPALSVEVRDAQGAPVPDARVAIRRVVVAPPPRTEVGRWTGRTGPDGTLRMDPIEEREQTLPLMMHGVPWYGWEICATHPRAGAAGLRQDADRPVVDPVALSLVLDPERADCGWERLDPAAP